MTLPQSASLINDAIVKNSFTITKMACYDWYAIKIVLIMGVYESDIIQYQVSVSKSMTM